MKIPVEYAVIRVMVLMRNVNIKKYLNLLLKLLTIIC